MDVKRGMSITILMLAITWPITVLSQSGNSLENVKELFTSNVTNTYQEKVFLDTDKPFYFTGETLWYKAYCVDAAFHTLSSISTVLYIEVIGNSGNVVLQQKI